MEHNTEDIAAMLRELAIAGDTEMDEHDKICPDNNWNNFGDQLCTWSPGVITASAHDGVIFTIYADVDVLAEELALRLLPEHSRSIGSME